MRFLSLAMCTLTVLLAGGLRVQASDSSSSEGSPREPAIHERDDATPTVTSTIEPIAQSERPEEQAFLQPAAVNSQQVSSSETSLSGQNAQAGTEGKVGVLAEATPQNLLVEIPKSEVLNPANIIAESSTLNAKQPTSDESANKSSSLSSPHQGGTEADTAISKAEALRPHALAIQPASAKASQILADAQPGVGATCVAQRVETPDSVGGSAANQLAQNSTTVGRCPRPQSIAPLVVPKVVDEFAASPALSIYIPVGYGADRNTVFLTGSYQNSVREDDGSVGAGGIGIGLGDASKALGVELSYALETTDDSFGEGGFNAKIHRRLGQDLSAAVGWNGFLNIGRNDFEQSKYGVITKVFRTQESLNNPFSRVAFTVGVGDGQFRSNGAVDAGDNNVNVFGNVAIRVVRPVSFIAEWTGQDLALGLSIAPFKNFPFVITPAVRDLAGAGDGARFVLGAGTAIRF
jgi:hypothetical protein